jgi:hypothetical protein
LRAKFGQKLAKFGQNLAKDKLALPRAHAVAIIVQLLTNNGQILAKNGKIITAGEVVRELCGLWPIFGPFLSRNWTISAELHV